MRRSADSRGRVPIGQMSRAGGHADRGAQMGIDAIVVLIMSGAYFICAGQVNASGNIGARSYSIWHDTHYLVQKEGLARLIRYKPKHFWKIYAL